MVDGGQAEAIAKELRELARLAPVDVRTASIAQIMDWARRVRAVLPRAEGALLHLDRLVADFDAVTSDPLAEELWP